MTNLRNTAYNLLRRSESFFKTDMVYLAKGGFWLTLGQGAASVSAFFLAIAFANLLPRETYGTYKYILAVGGTLGVFTLTGMGTAVTQAVARGIDGVLIPAFREKIKWGLLGSLVSFVGAGYYYLNDNITLSLGLVIIGIFMPAMDSLGIYDSVWQGKKRFDISTKYFIIGQISSVALSVLALFFTNNVLILILIYFASWTFFRLIFFRNTLNQLSGVETEVSSTLSYGKHLSLMGAIGVLANYADRILIFQFVGAAEAAIYSIAISIPEQIKAIFKGVGNLALPKFSEKAASDTHVSIWGKMAMMALILLIVTVAYILVAPIIFNLLFPQYLDSILYSQIFAVSLIAAVSVIPLAYLQALERKHELYLFNIASPVIQLIFIFIGAYFYGVLGVVMARVVARLTNMVLSLALMTKRN